jgi:fibronectin type 3 domain-containing protein
MAAVLVCCLAATLLPGVRATAQSSLVINVAAGGDVVSAANQVLAAGGGTINLAPGTYNIKSSIVLGSNTTLNGAGATTVLLGPPSPHTWPMVTEIGVACSNITIQNLVVDGNIPRGAYLVTPSGTNNPYSSNGIDLYSATYNVNNVTLQNLEIRNTEEGLHTGDGSNYLISNIYVHDNNPGSFAHNAYLTATSNVTVTHSRFLNAHAGSGLHLNFGNTGILITKSEFSGNLQEGLSNQSGSGNTVQDSIFNNNGVDGVYSASPNVLVQRSVAGYNGDGGFYNIGGTGQYNYLFGLGNLNGLDELYGLGGYGVTDLDQINTTTPNVYEAEFADGPTGATDTADWTTAYSGFSGAGAVDFNANHLTNGLLSFSHVGVVSAGNYSITFRYSNGSSGTLSMPLTVNGVAQTPISFPATASNSTWSTVSVTVPLNAGNNVIQISPSGSAAPEIDNLTVNTSTPSVPAAPTALTATAVTPYQVNLTWNAVAGAATYTVYQNGSPIAENVVATSYTDTHIFFGASTLSYTVVAVNQGGAGAVSSVVSVTTPIDTPAGLQVAAGNGAGNYLNWMSANGASYYNVKRATVSGGPYTTLAGVTNTTNLTSTNFEQTYEDAAAAVGTTYYYVVSAVDANGKESANSYEVGMRTPLTPQTITFAAVPSQAVGNTLTLTATASSGLPVSYAAVANGVCTVSGNVVTFVTTGSCGINASQAGNSTFAAAAAVGQVITVVTPVAQTITFAAVATQTSGTSLALTATASSGLPVSYASTTPGVCTVAGSTASFPAGGTCTITASQSGGGTYSAAPSVMQSFTVLQAQTITFNAIATQHVGTPLNLSGYATASSGLAVTWTYVQNGNCTISGNTVTFVNSGACGIIANQAGNATYAAAAPVGQVVQVAAALQSQTITFNAIATQRVGTPLNLSGYATATSGLPITWTYVNNGNCTISGTTVTFLNGGACGIIANQAGNATYAAAASVGQVVQVAAALQSQSITFKTIATQKVGTPLNLSGYATASSGLAVTWTYVNNGNCTISGTTVTFLNAGACGIIANQAGNASYAAAPAVGQVVQVAAK